MRFPSLPVCILLPLALAAPPPAARFESHTIATDLKGGYQVVVAVGHLGKQRFLTAIEAWHGNQTAIYRQQKRRWTRHVIDDTLQQGHTIVAAGLNGDGQDEIIAGYRAGGGGVLLYAFDKSANHWSRQFVEHGGIAANACAVADLNGDGRRDLVCIGGASTNLKWYENLPTSPAH